MEQSQFLINVGYGAAGMLGTFILKATWDAIKSMRADLQKLQESLPATYVRRDDFFREIEEVKDMLRRIADKLEEKADK